MYVLFFWGHGLELKRLAADRPPQVSTTDVVPCDCVLLRGACVANEATISGESVPQIMDAVPREARALDLDNDRGHCLFSGSRVVRASDGDSIPADSEIPATPDGGCLCYVLRTGFYSWQGELLQGHRVLAGERHRRFEGNHGRLRHFDVLCVGRRWVCVAARSSKARKRRTS